MSCKSRLISIGMLMPVLLQEFHTLASRAADGTPSAFRCSAVAAEILLPRGTGEAPVRFRENKLTFLWSPDMSAAQRTTDHQAIRRWIEKRGGRPARVKETAHT